MSAYVIVDLTPIDGEKLQQYSALAAESIEAFDGKFIAKGPIKLLHGEQIYQIKIIMEFPDREKADSWYISDSYQKIIDLRNEGMESQFHLVG